MLLAYGANGFPTGAKLQAPCVCGAGGVKKALCVVPPVWMSGEDSWWAEASVSCPPPFLSVFVFEGTPETETLLNVLKDQEESHEG